MKKKFIKPFNDPNDPRLHDPRFLHPETARRARIVGLAISIITVIACIITLNSDKGFVPVKHNEPQPPSSHYSAEGIVNKGETIMNPTHIKVVVVSTMDEVVQDILETLTEEQKADIRSKSKEDLIMYHHGWGTNIRNRYLLRQNEELLKNIGKEDADDASTVIIEAVWEALKIGDVPP